MKTTATASQLRATAALHERIAAANARFGVKAKHAPRHAEDAAKLRAAAEKTRRGIG